MAGGGNFLTKYKKPLHYAGAFAIIYRHYTRDAAISDPVAGLVSGWVAGS